MIGHDAEVFVVNGVGTPISSIGIVPGNKEYPFEVPCGAVQADNVLAEVNIHPANSAEEFVHNTKSVLPSLRAIVKETDASYDISAAISSYVFPDDELNDPAAHVFGCEPDFSGWGDDEDIVFVDPNLRSAGGHIHIGVELPNKSTERLFARLWEMTVGASTVQYEDAVRRTLYGQAGRYRRTAYGIEIRSPSNFWLKEEWMMVAMYTSAVWLVDNYTGLHSSRVKGTTVRRIINTCDTYGVEDANLPITAIPGGF